MIASELLRKKKRKFASPIVASLGYNFISLANARVPEETGSVVDTESLTREFYDLCNDLEQILLEDGEYPNSIEELSFSDALSYEHKNEGYFILTYDDKRLTLS